MSRCFWRPACTVDFSVARTCFGRLLAVVCQIRSFGFRSWIGMSRFVGCHHFVRFRFKAIDHGFPGIHQIEGAVKIMSSNELDGSAVKV